jgi:hypothetical protein
VNKLLKDYNSFDSSNQLKGKGMKRKTVIDPSINDEDDGRK